MLDLGGRTTYHEVSGWWKDAGRPEDILEANRLVLRDIRSAIKGKIEADSAVSGSMDIGEGTIVRRGAVLRGPVVIGDHFEIGEGLEVDPIRLSEAELELLGRR